MVDREIIVAIVSAGGQPRYVGGYVRDRLMGIRSKDVDVEVFGLSYAELLAAVRPFGHADIVGAQFGVINLVTHEGEAFDFSLPRVENRIGVGHRGFDVNLRSDLTVEQAAARRDFTMNSLSVCAETGEVADPFGGMADISARILRHTSGQFGEDPLRVLRGMQFAGRFNMTAAPETLEVCRAIISEYGDLAIERVWAEWEKWAAKSVRPSAGLRFLRDSGWIVNFPELAALIGTPQDPEWHPEGDAWQHTLHVCDVAAENADRLGLSADERIDDVLAALCHDLGKPLVTVRNEAGRWVSPGHDVAGVEVARRFLESIGASERRIRRICELVREHMVHVSLHEISDRVVRRLMARMHYATVEQLARLMEADHSGRPPLPPALPRQAMQLVEIAGRQGNRFVAFVMGRHLIGLGLEPGPHFGPILSEAAEAQIDGQFEDLESGIRWVAERLNGNRWDNRWPAGTPYGPDGRGPGRFRPRGK